MSDAEEEAEMQQKTAIDHYQWPREVCSTRLITGGLVVPGAVVETVDTLMKRYGK